jgi:hypothetical protein
MYASTSSTTLQYALLRCLAVRFRRSPSLCSAQYPLQCVFYFLSHIPVLCVSSLSSIFRHIMAPSSVAIVLMSFNPPASTECVDYFFFAPSSALLLIHPIIKPKNQPGSRRLLERQDRRQLVYSAFNYSRLSSRRLLIHAYRQCGPHSDRWKMQSHVVYNYIFDPSPGSLDRLYSRMRPILRHSFSSRHARVRFCKARLNILQDFLV